MPCPRLAKGIETGVPFDFDMIDIVHRSAPHAAIVPREAERLDQVQLVGIMGKPDDMTALFRMTRGNILRVKTGDQSQIGRIYEISEAGVVVTRSNGNSIFIPPIPVG